MEQFLTDLRPQIEKSFHLPADWKIMLLSQCGVVQTGIAKGRKYFNQNTVRLPYLRVANVQDGYFDLSEIKEIEILPDEVERFLLRKNDVLLTEGGDADKLGRGHIWNGEIAPCLHQNHIFCVRTDQKIILPIFFSYLVSSKYGKTYFLNSSKQTTNLASINSTQLKAFPCLVPSVPEQRKIAEILSDVDEAIAHTQAVIDQIQVVKRGLMQQSLIHGISSFYRSREIYALSEFPVNWSVRQLGSFATCKQGYTFKPKFQGKNFGKWMYAKVSDMERLGNERYIKYTANYINDSDLEAMGATPFPASTIIFPRVGAALLTNKKRILTTPSLVDDNIMTLTIKDLSVCLPSYLFRWLESIDLKSFANSGNPPSINSKNLLSGSIPLPTLVEQQKIVDILDSVDQRLYGEQTKKNQLEAIKKGLMQQLLTGKLRVPIAVTEPIGGE